jgi:hypothetical protein
MGRTAVSLLQPRPRTGTQVLICRESTSRDPLLTMEVLYQLSYVGVTLRIVAPRWLGAPTHHSLEPSHLGNYHCRTEEILANRIIVWAWTSVGRFRWSLPH